MYINYIFFNDLFTYNDVVNFNYLKFQVLKAATFNLKELIHIFLKCCI